MVNDEKNPSYECMRVAKEESRAELLEIRRWDVSRRLKALELGEGSHKNLSAIANVIYEPCFVWTKDACEYLRDQLVYLIGGERDAQRGCSGGDGDCVRHDVQTSLDKERQEVIDELRKIPSKMPLVDDPTMQFYEKLSNALGIYTVQMSFGVVRDHLIHLLGGDVIVRYPENYNLEDEHEVQNNKNGDFCKLDNVTITDELRKWAKSCTVRDMVLTTYPVQHAVHGTLEQLIAIADRIDEQFARICEQQEKVLQETIDETADELDILRSKNLAVYAHNKVNMYLVLLRDTAREYKELHDNYDELSRDYRMLLEFTKSIEGEVKYPFILRYDTLSKERHNAVCELRNLEDDVDNCSSYYDFTEKLLNVFKINDYCWDDRLMSLCDRLIHLLGEKEGREECPVLPHFVENQQNHQKEGKPDAKNDENGEILQTSDYLDLLRDAACEYKELYDLLESIEHDVNDGGLITLFGVNYAPVSTDYETFEDMALINLHYKKLKQWMGEAKSLRDNLATRVEGRDRVRQELEECRKALNETAGKLVKADAECRMYRDLLNDEAREYVRHKEATDSMYASFNEVFDAIEKLF